MADVAFRLAFKTEALNTLDLPIEIRKPDSTLINRVLATETIDLAAGRYYAVASMPGGQRLLTPFDVTEPPAQTPLWVTLAPEPEDESPHEWEEVRHFLGRQRDRVAPAPAPRSLRRRLDRASNEETAALTSRPAPFLRIFSGNVLAKVHQVVPPQTVLQVLHADANRVMQFQVSGREAPLIAQLVQPGGQVQNLTLPVSANTNLQLVASREPTGEVRLDAYLPNSAANMLLQYTGAGLSTTAAKATNASAMKAEQLLQQKMSDPIAAAVGGYAMLRLGSIEQLHDWTANLRHSFQALPDGAAICGEHLARLGRFEEAFDAFAEVPLRGLPLFSDGLFYTVERMKLYSGQRLKSAGRIDVARARAILDQLQPFAAFVRRQRPVCSYPGPDVAAPSDDLAAADGPGADGFDLSQWFPPGR